MEFCPHCGTVLREKKENDKLTLACGKCGYKQYFEKKDLYTPKPIAKQEKTSLIVVDSTVKQPTVYHKCDACGHDRAYLKEIKPSFITDEMGINLYTCEKCGKTVRQKE